MINIKITGYGYDEQDEMELSRLDKEIDNIWDKLYPATEISEEERKILRAKELELIDKYIKITNQYESDYDYE